jgi:hypothetical protein
MAQKTTYYCDGCGREKGEVNHWFGVRVDEEGWTLKSFSYTGVHHIYCGQECVHKALSEYMERCREKVGV